MVNQIFTEDQNQEIMRRLRRAMVSIQGKKLPSAAWFSMEELCNGEWRFAGADEAETVASGGAETKGWTR